MFLALSVCFTTGCGKGDKDKKEDKKEKTAKPVVQVNRDLQQRLKEFAEKPRTKGAFGFMVYDLTAGKPVYGFNQKQAQPSASCMKLLSGVAGLHLLGTNYMYSTRIYTRGHLEGDTLRGDLIFKGSLDPQLRETDFPTFAKAIRRKGIKSVSGNLVLDLVITEPVKSEQHWYPWDLSFSKYGILFKGEDKVRRGLKNAFRQQGIALKDSQLVRGKLTRDAHCVLQICRPVKVVIQRMWKNSSNTQATSLLYAIGHKVNPKAEPTSTGVNYLRHFLSDSLGQRDKHLVVHDGCGLCTYNRLSPEALVAVLRYGYRHKDIYAMMHRYLAVSGVDGTLRIELSDPRLRGKVHAKTGTLSHPYGISSLAGFCESGNGHVLAFAIMDSDMSVLDARVLQKKLCLELTK